MKPQASSADIVLLQLPTWGRDHPPLALAQLKAYLTEQGFRAACLDLNNEFFLHLQSLGTTGAHWEAWNEDAWFDRPRAAALISQFKPFIETWAGHIAALAPRIVGCRIVHTSQVISEAICAAVRRRLPSAIMVFGGPKCTNLMAPSELFHEPAVDIAVVGEGEATLAEICTRAGQGQSLQGIAGTIIRDGTSFRREPLRPQMDHLDALPIPDYSDFDLARYENPKVLPSYLGRGCVLSCAFCSERTFWKKFRARSGQRAAYETLLLHRRYPSLGHIQFLDDAVNSHIPALLEFARAKVRSGSSLTWGGQAIVRKEMTPDACALLKDSGCNYLSFGLETASDKVLRAMGKLATAALASQVFKACHDAGIVVTCNFMFGFPGETEADFADTLHFVEDNAGHIDMAFPSPRFCGMSEGTPIYDKAGKFNVEDIHGLYWVGDGGANTYPVRLARFERFLEKARELGVKTSYPHLKLHERHWHLGRAYAYMGNWHEALYHLRYSLEHEGYRDDLAREIAYLEDVVRGAAPDVISRRAAAPPA